VNQPPEKTPIPPIVDRYRDMSDCINRKPTRAIREDFPRTFKIYMPTEGVKNILAVDDVTNVCQDVPDNSVADDVLKFTQSKLLTTPGYKWDYDKSAKCVKFWKAITDTIPRPPAFGWADDPRTLYHRLPWAIGDGSFDGLGMPTWDELFSRITNREALVHFIGSIFVEKSSNQQYVWINGEGGDGKGSLFRFLVRAMGSAGRSTTTPGRFGPSEHYSYQFVDKRLIAFPDNNSASFVQTGLFKALTGEDFLTVNQKFKDPYDVKLNAKIMFGSNHQPDISSQISDLRRLILCHITAPQPLEDGFRLTGRAWEDQLWAEGGDFLKYCIASYKEHCSDNEPIACDMADAQAAAEVSEEPLEAFINKHFVIYEDDPNVVERDKPFVSPADFSDVLETAGRGKKFFATDVRNYLKRKYQISKKPVKLEGGKLEKRYVNLGLQPKEPSAYAELAKEFRVLNFQAARDARRGQDV